ncbi:MAG: 50S ribosomal protein L20 [Candidatus Harrisonbacteria bacterium CG10_big_fil_rev_8_21_14_0_10_49_15]|uniref:Large ribosomal subunit protein bL20 n=1 Tax=Candidatus Harrisonbacteria bacterium CG10_big_fil_rev_8_21_14_0_10_49_15 TaxID=1974587 RepID=A0A2H0ULL8_9BACT|nr:MAG: 50S ribosomal protein L20 [Candidatus Harrisonbacteria bacterium CG10_big_fil_rev_8_21_14_0_10_49_15]
MPRVKTGPTGIRKRKKLLKHTKGFNWDRKSKERAAREALLHAWTNAYRSRKEKKRTSRRLWQIKINAAVREQDMSYSVFINALKKKDVIIDRKILADIAEHQPEVFKQIVDQVTTR